jgi:hypothetical protein
MLMRGDNTPVCKKEKDKLLSHFTMDRHQKTIKQEDIKLDSLVPSLHGSNVISSNDKQSIKHYVELQRDQLEQCMGN